MTTKPDAVIFIYGNDNPAPDDPLFIYVGTGRPIGDRDRWVQTVDRMIGAKLVRFHAYEYATLNDENTRAISQWLRGRKQMFESGYYGVNR